MRICVVSLNLAAYYDPTPRARYGGAEVQAAFVAQALAAAGHEVSLVVADLPTGVKPPYPTFAAFDSRAGLPGLRFLHPRMSGILSALSAANADLYYQRNAGMVTGVVANFCAQKRRTFVYGAGSDTDFSFKRVLVDGLRDRTLYYYGLRRANGVVVQNESQRRMAETVIRSPVRMIPNGAVPPRTSAVSHEGVLVWAGGVRRVKRPDLFVELARRMPERRFVLVGGGLAGEGTYADDIARAARQLPNLTLTGWRPNSDVIAFIRGAALVVNTSEVEGFPNVYLEAWNHGVPVVTFNDVDGLIAGNGLGEVCANLDDMEAAVRRLLGDGAELRAAGDRACRLVAERYSPQALGPLYSEFFSELVPARR